MHYARMRCVFRLHKVSHKLCEYHSHHMFFQFRTISTWQKNTRCDEAQTMLFTVHWCKHKDDQFTRYSGNRNLFSNLFSTLVVAEWYYTNASGCSWTSQLAKDISKQSLCSLQFDFGFACRALSVHAQFSQPVLWWITRPCFITWLFYMNCFDATTI